jgi:hypothetical protein
MSTLGNTAQYAKAFKIDTILTNGSASYTMQYRGTNETNLLAEQLLVSVNGVIQNPGSAFTLSGSTITFTETLDSSDSIDFINVVGESHAVATVSDNTITPSKLASTLAITDTPVRINTNSINTKFTIDSDKNAMVAGPISLNSNIVINGTLTIV